MNFIKITFLILLMSVSAFAQNNSALQVCNKMHSKNKTRCKSISDVSSTRSVTSTLSYMYEDCRELSIVVLFLDRVMKTKDHNSYLSCYLSSTIKSGGMKQEIITDMGTSLIIEVEDGEVKTTVKTSEGEIACKSSQAGEKLETWWCGLILKPSKSYVEISNVKNSDLTTVFYNKKKLSTFLKEAEVNPQSTNPVK
jgi:hypothetical protein